MGAVSGGADVVVQLGPLPIFTFGLATALAFAVGTAVTLAQAARWGWPPERLFPAAPLVMLAGVLGARAAYVLIHWSDYRYDLAAVVRLQEGGFVFYGALAAGAVALAAYARRAGLDGRRALDAAAPGLALGQAVGLVGTHMPGRAATVPWAVPLGDEWVHPLAAYGIILCYWLFFALWRLGRRPIRRGRLFLVYLFLHGLGWTVIESWAAAPRFAGLTLAQWSGLATAAAAVAGLFLLPRTDAYSLPTVQLAGLRLAGGPAWARRSRAERVWAPVWRAGGWLAGLAALLGVYGLRWI